MPDPSARSSTTPIIADDFDFGALADLISNPTGSPPEVPGTGGGARRCLGDYLLESEIARGGMGVVYRATQLSLDRTVAVKMLRDSFWASGSEVERFRREAAAAAGLRHRNIVGIYEIADQEGMPYFSMEYVPGPTLAQVLVHGPMAPRHAAEVMIKVSDAVHYAHLQGVLHRDLKPSNVIMDPASEPMVTDFGLAKNDFENRGLTLSGQVLGTPAYMAPEQAQGLSKEAGPASDVYGLGALLYHLLTGRAPFSGESHLAILQQVLTDDPVSMRMLTPSLSADLETICGKAMAKEPDRRYPCALAFSEDLQRYLDGRDVLARPIPGLARAWRWARRHPALASSLTGIAFLLVTVAVGASIAAGRLGHSEEESRKARDLARTNAAKSKLNLYASDMRNAMESWNRGSLDAMRQRLAVHLPVPGEEDPRGFEWFMLDALGQGQQTRLTALPGNPTSAVFTPDAAYALFSIGDRTHLWDAETNTPWLEWDEPTPAADISYRKLLRLGANHLVSAYGTGLRMIDLTARQVRLIDPTPCESMALSGDGTLLAVASRSPGGENTNRPWVRIYRTADWTVAKELIRESRGLEWAPSGLLVVLSVPADRVDGVAGRLEWFEPGQFDPTRHIDIHFTSAVRLGWLDTRTDQAYLMLENLDDQVIRMSTGEGLQGRPSSAFLQAAVNPPFTRMVNAGQDQTLRILELDTWRLKPYTRRGHTDRVLGLAYIGEGRRVRSLSRDGTLREWDFSEGPHDHAYGLIHADFRTAALALSAGTGRYIGMLEEWSGQNGRDRSHIFDRETHQNVLTLDSAVMGVSSDGSMAIGLHRDKIDRTDLRPAEVTEVTRLHQLPRQPVGWLPRITPDWRHLAWTADLKELIISDLNTSSEVGRYPLLTGAPVISPDGKRLALPQRTILLVTIESGAAIDTGLACGPLLAWSADGRKIASLVDNEVHVYDLGTKQRTHRLVGHRGTIGSMAWSPDGRSLAVGCDDSTLLFWHLATSRPTAEVELHGGAFLLGFSDDGSCLVAGTMKGYRILRTRPFGVSLASDLPHQ